MRHGACMASAPAAQMLCHTGVSTRMAPPPPRAGNPCQHEALAVMQAIEVLLQRNRTLQKRAAARQQTTPVPAQPLRHTGVSTPLRQGGTVTETFVGLVSSTAAGAPPRTPAAAGCHEEPHWLETEQRLQALEGASSHLQSEVAHIRRWVHCWQQQWVAAASPRTDMPGARALLAPLTTSPPPPFLRGPSGWAPSWRPGASVWTRRAIRLQACWRQWTQATGPLRCEGGRGSCV